MVELRRDLLRTRELAYESFIQCIDESNKLWQGILHLIVTLAASFLVLTIALVEKLFPTVTNISTLPKFLIISWILLFVSIICGIISEVDENIFHSNRARSKGRYLNELDKKIAQGLKEDTIELKDDSDNMIHNTIFWGAVCIDTFIIAILCMCFALLIKIIPRNACIIIFLSTLFVLILVNIHLLRKRNK